VDRDDEAGVTAGGLCVHVGAPDGAVLITEAHDVVDLVLFADVGLSGISNVDSLLLVLVNLQIRFGWLEQVSNLFHIDLDHAHFDREFYFGWRFADLFEDVVDHARHYTALFWVVDDTCHSVRLARTRLTVCEHCPVKPLHDALNNWLHGAIEHHMLLRLSVEDLVVVVLYFAVVPVWCHTLPQNT